LALLSVADLDVEIDRQRHRRATLPERAELVAIVSELSSLDDARRSVAAERDEVAGRQATLESELAATEHRIREVERRLYGGEVSAARELQAMSADVEGLRARSSDLEDRGLAALEEREPLDAAVDSVDEEIAAHLAQRGAVEQSLAAAEAEVDDRLSDLGAERTAATAQVPAELLERYEQIRRRVGGAGAARLVSGRCDGCHLALPAVEVDRLRHLDPDVMVTCDQCGRILVRP
jgi:predicted  nucleic acid-binding Zn-ribbon protein